MVLVLFATLSGELVANIAITKMFAVGIAGMSLLVERTAMETASILIV